MSTASDKTAEIYNQIQTEINHMLTTQNFNNDNELLTAMDGNKNIPISIIMNKLSIKIDEHLVLDILAKCSLCVLSADKLTIKPNLTMERRTVILREVDESATEEQIRGLFDESFGPIQEIQKELSKTWFVTFDSEPHAKAAALQAMKQEINNSKVRAGLKNESTLTSNPTIPPPQIMMDYDNDTYAYYDYGYQNYFTNQYEIYQENDVFVNNANYKPKNNRSYEKKNRKNSNSKKDRKYTQNTRKHEEFYKPSVPTTPAQPLSFPPLAVEDTPVGYTEPYIAYDVDDVVRIARNYSKFSLPLGLEPGDHSCAITDKPNSRLVESQRSMSIDQALEHNRPIRFDPVEPTDFAVMMYGEVPQLKPLPATTSGVIPPPFEPKGYAAIVKQGKTPAKTNSTPKPVAPPSEIKKEQKPKTWDYHPANPPKSKPNKPVHPSKPTSSNSNSWASIVNRPNAVSSIPKSPDIKT